MVSSGLTIFASSPVSSRTSRRAASAGVSPSDTAPFGRPQRVRPRVAIMATKGTPLRSERTRPPAEYSLRVLRESATAGHCSARRTRCPVSDVCRKVAYIPTANRSKTCRRCIMPSLEVITVLGVLVLAGLIWFFVRTLSHDRLDAIMKKRAATAKLVTPADYVEGGTHIPVLLALDAKCLYYENLDLQASLD